MISPLMVYTSILDHSSRPLKNSLLTSHLEEPWDNFPLLDGLPHPGGIVTIRSHLLGGWARPSEKSESMGRINYPIYIIYEMEKKKVWNHQPVYLWSMYMTVCRNVKMSVLVDKPWFQACRFMFGLKKTMTCLNSLKHWILSFMFETAAKTCRKC